jgi:dephospho-CoA kinase
MILGLTGGIASGKSSAAEVLQGLGLRVIDCDELAHFLTNNDPSILTAIEHAFGEVVLNQYGRLDRVRLGSLVFADRAKRRMLETILHPPITGLCAANAKQARYMGRHLVILAPLLFEGGLEKLCDAVMLISSSRETQIERLARSRGYSREEALARIEAQMTEEQRLAKADFVVDNNGSIEEFRGAVAQGWKALAESFAAEGKS